MNLERIQRNGWLTYPISPDFSYFQSPTVGQINVLAYQAGMSSTAQTTGKVGSGSLYLTDFSIVKYVDPSSAAIETALAVASFDTGINCK